MKKVFLALAVLCSITLSAQNEIRLLIRADDIGSFRAANLACVDSYTKGIVRSTEVMVCCPWFPEAARMLNENPGLDAGVHLMITSEWVGCKWAPLTKASSITDENGYFYPFIWPVQGKPGIAVSEHDWKPEEIEAEFRAQIELAKKHIPHVSHLSAHMGCTNWNPEVEAMAERLAKEYGLPLKVPEYVKRFPKFGENGMSNEQLIDAFAKAIETLAPGTYYYVEHPSYDTPEMEGVSLNYPENGKVAKERQLVTDMFTSDKVKKAVEKNKVKLIDHKDLQ